MDINLEKLTEDSEKIGKNIFNFCNLDWNNKSFNFKKKKDLQIKTTSNIQLRGKVKSYDYDNDFEKQILELGEDINKIKHVFVTHIHLDHSGGAWRFAKNGATIYVHPKGEPHLANPEKLIDSATRIYGDKMDVLWGKVDKIDSKQIYSVKENEVIKIDNYKLIKKTQLLIFVKNSL